MNGNDDHSTDRRINAMPTKELFIDMLTKDISLIPALLDLVDNCVDGARRHAGEGPYNDYWARIELSEEEFRISDNCGGMSIDIAENYAFRFGRSEGSPAIPHSIGEFGVGMKRAIFKIGDDFRVESTTLTSRFLVRENIPTWAAEPEWLFTFDELTENAEFAVEQVGTMLVASRLKPDVASEFGREGFRNVFREELRAKLRDPISRGFSVSLNGIPIHSDPLELIDKEELAPAFAIRFYPSEVEPLVTARFFAGLGESKKPPEAGWHVFCNGRLILAGDKSSVVGWGTGEETPIPGFHGQYNRFRGYVYFDSDDAGQLPWNTTKTGLDLDSAVYRASRLQMRAMMRPVVDFLNKLKAEREQTDSGPLQTLLDGATSKELDTVRRREKFATPEVKPSKRPSDPSTDSVRRSRGEGQEG